ncbi:MAG: hypothetical protein ACLS7Z_10850 [Christensenellales bacterium]
METGLTTLVASNDALNQGAARLSAPCSRQPISSRRPDWMRPITLPELTSENYADVLERRGSAQHETLLETAKETARAQAKAEVMKQEKAVREPFLRRSRRRCWKVCARAA